MSNRLRRTIALVALLAGLTAAGGAAASTAHGLDLAPITLGLPGCC